MPSYQVSSLSLLAPVTRAIADPFNKLDQSEPAYKISEEGGQENVFSHGIRFSFPNCKHCSTARNTITWSPTTLLMVWPVSINNFQYSLTVNLFFTFLFSISSFLSMRWLSNVYNSVHKKKFAASMIKPPYLKRGKEYKTNLFEIPHN